MNILKHAALSMLEKETCVGKIHGTRVNQLIEFNDLEIVLWTQNFFTFVANVTC